MESRQKAGDSHFSNGHILVWGFCVVGEKNLVGNFTGLWRLCFFEAAALSVRPNGQSQWTPENCSPGSWRVTAAVKQMMSNCAARVWTQMLYFLLESRWELGRICTKCCNLRFRKDVSDEEQMWTWQTDLYGQFQPQLNNLYGCRLDVEVCSQDTIALCNIHQPLLWRRPGSADMTQADIINLVWGFVPYPQKTPKGAESCTVKS